MFNPKNSMFGFTSEDLLKKFSGRIKSRTSRSATISEDIVDAEYEDVTKAAPSSNENKKRTFDKNARAQEIVKAAEEKFLTKSTDNPDKMMTSIMNMMMFTMGAEWADEHPQTSFPSFNDWGRAMSDEIMKITGDAQEQSATVTMLVMLTFTLGAKWADKNPPKYV